MRQGGSESPYFYNVYAYHCMKEFAKRYEAEGIEPLEIPYKYPKECRKERDIESGFLTLRWLGYADDLVLFAKTARDLDKMVNILNTVFLEYWLRVNVSKTETLT